MRAHACALRCHRSLRIGVDPFPAWVNRFANAGAALSSVPARLSAVPASLGTTMIGMADSIMRQLEDELGALDMDMYGDADVDPRRRVEDADVVEIRARLAEEGIGFPTEAGLPELLYKKVKALGKIHVPFRQPPIDPLNASEPTVAFVQASREPPSSESSQQRSGRQWYVRTR